MPETPVIDLCPEETIVDPYFSDVVLLLPFDEAAGASSHTDYSLSAKTPTVNAGTQLTTAVQAKWGTTSLKVAANVAADATYYYRSADFRRTNTPYTEMTIEYWYWRADGGWNSTSSPPIMIWRADDGVPVSQHVNYGANGLLDVNGHPQVGYTGSAWHFVAIVMDSSNSYRLYLDGVLQSTTTGFTCPGGLPYIHVGSFFAGVPSTPYQESYMQDLRVTRRARYSGPTCPVPTGFFPREAAVRTSTPVPNLCV